jgi:hypothetical protein
MRDLSHWDFATEFRHWEAASLMAGVDPAYFNQFKTRTYPIAKRLDHDSINSFALGERWVRESPKELECCKPQRDHLMFERAELVRWLSEVGLHSSYRFDLSHLDVGESLTGTKAIEDDGIDPSDLPPELDAANTAFRAITKGYGDQAATLRNRLVDFLGKHYPDFNSEQVQRIATVANPDKTTGRKKSGKE